MRVTHECCPNEPGTVSVSRTRWDELKADNERLRVEVETCAARFADERSYEEIQAENQRLREEVNEFNMNSAAEQMQIVGLADQLTELRVAVSALVEHIDRKYYDTVAPSQAAIERHAELGRHAIAVLAKLQPSAAEPR